MLAINLCVSINSSVILIFLFTPKLYIILWKPEKNTKGNFILTTDIRSYQGNEKRSHSKQQKSKDYQLQEKERKTNDENVLKEQMQCSIVTVGGELTESSKIPIAAPNKTTIAHTNEQMTMSKKETKPEDDNNSNNLQKIDTMMTEKVNVRPRELNHSQMEVAKKKEENQSYVNTSFVNSE